MADKDTITTKFKVDVSDLKKGITEANQQIKLANSAFKAASDGTKEWENSSAGLQAKLKQMQSVLDAQNKKLDSYKSQLETAKKYQQEASDKVETLKKALDEAKKAYGDNSDEVKALTAELNAAEQAELAMNTQVTNLTVTMNNQQGIVNSTATEIKNLESKLVDVESAENDAEDGANDLDDSLKDTGKSAKDSSDGFSVMKGALADLVADGIKKAIEALKDFVKESIDVGKKFDSSMSQVAAVSGVSADELQKLRDKAKKMGAATKFSATEASDAFNYMAMSGWKTEEMLNGIDGVLALAAASNTDLAETSSIVTGSLTAMGYASSEAGRLADVLSAATSNSNTNVSMMGETFKNAAPLAGSLGYSMEDLSLAAGLLANNNIQSAEAGTALRNIMIGLTDTTGKAGQAVSELGVETVNADGTLRPLGDVIVDLRDSFSGLTDVEKKQKAETIAGKSAMNGLLAIVNSSPEDFNKLKTAIENSNGAAENMSAIMQDNLEGDLTTLSSKVEGAQIALYEQFEPALRTGVEALQGLVDVVMWVIDNGSTFVSIITAMGIGIAAYVAYTTALQIMQGGFMSLSIVQQAVTAAQWLMNAAMNANPIGIVIGLISALVAGFVLLWNNSEGFRQFWIGLWENIKAVCAPVVEAILGFYAGLWANIQAVWAGATEFFSGVWNGIVTTFSGVSESIGGFFTDAWNAVQNTWNNVTAFFSGVVAGIQTAFTPITTFFSGIWNTIAGTVTVAWNGIKNTISGVFTAIQNSWNGLTGFVNGVIGGIQGAFSSLVNKVKGAVNLVISGINGAIGIINAIPGVNISRIPELARGGILEKGQIGLLEGNGAEAVVPLERNKYWIAQVTKELSKQMKDNFQVQGAGNINTNNNTNFTQIINAPKAPSRLELYRQTRNLLNLKVGV